MQYYEILKMNDLNKLSEKILNVLYPVLPIFLFPNFIPVIYKMIFMQVCILFHHVCILCKNFYNILVC